jgi:hypothetical protein
MGFTSTAAQCMYVPGVTRPCVLETRQSVATLFSNVDPRAMRVLVSKSLVCIRLHTLRTGLNTTRDNTDTGPSPWPIRTLVNPTSGR